MKKIFTADFETTTIAPARVWAWGLCEVGNPNNVLMGENLDDFFNTCRGIGNPTLYFHNLKFDDSYILDYLLTNGYTWQKDKKLCSYKDFTTIISDDGKFYGTDIYFSKKGKHTDKITILDSLKLLNMPVSAVAKAFDLPIKKGCIDYDRHNNPCPVTAEEWGYLKNDVQIMAMALYEMITDGFDKMTIGSCALADYKKDMGKDFERFFPVLDIETDSKIRMSYKGGYTFANPENQGKDIGKGIVFDVNSLYPSVMAYRPLPYGVPLEFSGKYETNKQYPLYVQNLRCFFKLKPNHLPTIQLKNNPFFNSTSYLESSVNSKTGVDELTELCLTSVDLELFLKHYDIFNVEWLGGYMFKSSTTLFCNWVKKWNEKKIAADKQGNKGKRTIAKLVLNNLYGKFALNPFMGSKYPYFDENENIVKYSDIEYELCDENGNPIRDENGKIKTTNKAIRNPIYIPVGTFITAWARYTTITASQKIHEESIQQTGHSRYLYSDTDSIHLSGFDYPTCIDIDSRELGKWKHESSFERARFLQAKRYIEDEIYTDNGHLIKNGYGDFITDLKITCAGMPDNCYKYVTWENFKQGTKYIGKLTPKTVQGGIILIPIEFSMNGKKVLTMKKKSDIII